MTEIIRGDFITVKNADAIIKWRIDMEKINILQLPKISFDERQKLPNKSGIYFACQFDEVLYIGKSVDIRKRWYSHHKQKELELISGIEIRWLECQIEELNRFEQFYIEEFNPPLNYSQKWIVPSPVVIPPQYPFWIWIIFIFGAIAISLGETIVTGHNLFTDPYNGFAARVLLTFGGILLAFSWGFHYGVDKYHKLLISKIEMSES
jgi:hypothetical protein